MMKHDDGNSKEAHCHHNHHVLACQPPLIALKALPTSSSSALSTSPPTFHPQLGLSVFRPVSDFLQEDLTADEKENVPASNPSFDLYDLTPQDTPKLGDLIELDRTLYSHWALYVGDGRVVHITGEDDQDLPDTEHAVVKESFLHELAGYSYVRVNNKLVPAKDRGLSTFDTDTVLANAKSMVGGRVEYNFLTKNAEHYLTEWKYGKAWSDQVCNVTYFVTFPTCWCLFSKA